MKRIHVIPVGDLDIHEAQKGCWCHPAETESCLFVHNAKDCREAKERTPRAVGIGYDTGPVQGWINIRELVSELPAQELIQLADEIRSALIDYMHTLRPPEHSKLVEAYEHADEILGRE